MLTSNAVYAITTICVWLLFWLFFFVLIPGKSRSRESLPRSNKLAVMSLLLNVFIIVMYSILFFAGEIPIRFFYAITGIGYVLFIGGLVLMLRARICIYRIGNKDLFSAFGNTIIQTGPYARIRHPMYTGIVTALIGSLVISFHWLALALLVVGIMPLLIAKAVIEERRMRNTHTAEYKKYAVKTGMFLPRMIS